MFRRTKVEANVEALVHFLSTTGTVTDKSPNRKAIEPGRLLYEQSGCAACHGSKSGDSAAMATTVPIGNADLQIHLRQPDGVPSGPARFSPFGPDAEPEPQAD